MKVKELAKELHTTEEDVIQWASLFNKNDDRIEGDEVPRLIENYVRLCHLEETHPKLFSILEDACPPYAYERWLWSIKEKIGGA